MRFGDGVRTQMITLYHTTTADAANAIVANGFKDGTGTYLTDHEFTGVWLSDRPLGFNEGTQGDTILAVDFDGDLSELQDYEWVEERKLYRAWLVMAAFLNERCTVRLMEDE